MMHRTCLAIIGAILLGLSAGGCESHAEQLALLRQTLQDVGQAIEDQEARLAELEPGTPEHAEASALLEKARTTHEQIAELANATIREDGTIDVAGGIAAGGALLPPPWGIIAGIAGPIVGAGLVEWRRRQQVGEMIEAMRESGLDPKTVAPKVGDASKKAIRKAERKVVAPAAAEAGGSA